MIICTCSLSEFFALSMLHSYIPGGAGISALIIITGNECANRRTHRVFSGNSNGNTDFSFSRALFVLSDDSGAAFSVLFRFPYKLPENFELERKEFVP